VWRQATPPLRGVVAFYRPRLHQNGVSPRAIVAFCRLLLGSLGVSHKKYCGLYDFFVVFMQSLSKNQIKNQSVAQGDKLKIAICRLFVGILAVSHKNIDKIALGDKGRLSPFTRYCRR